MAWTQTDLDRIERAIATGELTVRMADGKLVTYRSVSELERARGIIKGVVDAASATPRHRAIFASYAKE